MVRVARALKTNFTNYGHTVYRYKTTLYRLYKPDPGELARRFLMAKDRNAAKEPGDGEIASHNFRSKHSAGNEAVARMRGRSYVEQLLLA
jgi:hypothetical protein